VTTLVVEGSEDDRYREAAAAYGAALERLACAYEADPDHRRDLLQEIHLALWRSFAGWDARCSLRTWVYRVAHNAATSHVIRQRRMNSHLLVSLEELDRLPGPAAPDAGHQEALSRLLSYGSTIVPQRVSIDKSPKSKVWRINHDTLPLSSSCRRCVTRPSPHRRRDSLDS
jgi:DNA-directed RNA polymerase specialized sigma24 family protein